MRQKEINWEVPYRTPMGAFMRWTVHNVRDRKEAVSIARKEMPRGCVLLIDGAYQNPLRPDEGKLLRKKYKVYNPVLYRPA